MELIFTLNHISIRFHAGPLFVPVQEENLSMPTDTQGLP